MSRARWRWVVAGLVAAVIALAIGVYHVASRCEPGGMIGEMKREANGKILYYNGACWTTKPMPPRDGPF